MAKKVTLTQTRTDSSTPWCTLQVRTSEQRQTFAELLEQGKVEFYNSAPDDLTFITTYIFHDIAAALAIGGADPNDLEGTVAFHPDVVAYNEANNITTQVVFEDI